MTALGEPLVYLPFAAAVYDLSPALVRLDWSAQDPHRRFLQIDREYPKYLANKVAGRRERATKYVQAHELSPELQRAAIVWLIGTLETEYPGIARDLFRAGRVFSLEEICEQIPEDVALISTEKTTGGRRNWISFLSLYSPGHWAAEDKIGLDFMATHAPVAGIERVTARAPQLVEAMISKGPFERFVWGFSNDDQLNHHPQNAARALQIPPKDAALYFRVERQVLVPLPDCEAALFLIRTYHYDLRRYANSPADRANLKKALDSMCPASRQYRGIEHCYDDLVKWLS